MKKILFAALAAFTLFGATTASAAHLVRENIGWYHSGTRFDRLQISSTFADTTAFFGVDGSWEIPANGSADTLNIGALVVSADTNTTYTANLTKFDVKILAYSNDGVNPTVCFSQISATITTADKLFTVPIFISNATAFRLLQRGPFPFMGNKIRVVISGTTGTMNAAKAELIHYAP